MSNKLVPTIVKYGNSFIEAYKRATRASPEEQSKQELTPTGENQAIVGISSISEYIVWQTRNIKGGEKRTFKLSRWGEDLDFKSLVVENPLNDYFYLRIYDASKTSIVDFYISRNRTPLVFDYNPIPRDITIEIEAKKDIGFVRLIATPCKILESFFAEEDYQQNNKL